MKSIKKIKKLYPTEKGLDVYPFILREHQSSNEVALQGFSRKEMDELSNYIIRVRENIVSDFDQVKKGIKDPTKENKQ